ncbi:hypothetical protein CPZ44_002006 [Escherichia coli]|uniref:hypothetical protein n=1 Tax=Escherichia coli TaxID=562 RepID=UPI0002BC2E16|nr:hypothetical protein [Escherichia coli]EAB7524834.1 hypothetical protein [Escherichia coli]EEW0418985.1 hypothetical protein [Escherichia coli]EEW3500032.1 hypothetical protein [Escherichia coli]EEX9683821.1 hypothetical protein [Escherichia coli]EEZ4661316.1 hypothetical protein [Escherichia coli]
MLIFLRQQNGALSVEILYFLAGSVMHHSDVVSIAQNNVEINRVLSKTWKYILNRRTRRFFLFIFFSWLATAGLFHILATPGAYHIK